MSKSLYLKKKRCFKLEYSHSNHWAPFAFLLSFYKVHFSKVYSNFLERELFTTLHHCTLLLAMGQWFFFFSKWNQPISIISIPPASRQIPLSPAVGQTQRQLPSWGAIFVSESLAPSHSLPSTSGMLGRSQDWYPKAARPERALRCLGLYPGSPFRAVWA